MSSHYWPAIRGENTMIDLPLDVRATAFQQKVWQTLRQIPRGETRSYSEVAREIGDPHAVRAVARACASNPVALAVPCHRVVRSDGELAGYRWGIERKKKLLEAERVTLLTSMAPFPGGCSLHTANWQASCSHFGTRCQIRFLISLRSFILVSLPARAERVCVMNGRSAG